MKVTNYLTFLYIIHPCTGLPNIVSKRKCKTLLYTVYQSGGKITIFSTLYH